MATPVLQALWARFPAQPVFSDFSRQHRAAGHTLCVLEETSLTLFAAAAERLGRLGLSMKCRDILRVAERQEYAPCVVTEQHLAN